MYDELKHHGIKGMRWGHRKSIEVVSRNNKQYNIPLKKSKYRLALENKYRANGMSAKDAEIAAHKNIRTKKIIAAVAGVTLAAATAYVAHDKYTKEFCDRVIRAGTEMHTVANDANRNMGNPFYSAISIMDRMKYRGIYGSQLSGGGLNRVHDIATVANAPVKIASRRNAVETFSNLYNNNENFRTQAARIIPKGNLLNNDAQRKVYSQAHQIINSNKPLSKKDMDSLYNAYNLSLHLHDNNGIVDKTHNIFYNALRSKGYGAITDLNDTKYSGFATRTANIVFDSSSIVKKSVTELSRTQINSDLKKSHNVMIGKQVAKMALAGLALGYATKEADDYITYKNRRDNNAGKNNKRNK